MTKMKKENLIKDSKRIVIKIGSSLLIDKNEGNLKSAWLRSLAQEINQLIKQKKEIIIVSSGSIAPVSYTHLTLPTIYSV